MLKTQALKIIENSIHSCNLCPSLAEQRQNFSGKYVPGTGNSNAEIFILGEAPGSMEEKSGLPFVGQSGELLTNILKAAGLNRNQVFITNVLKCRPSNNRNPFPEEATNCRKFLDMQIRCVDPSWILCFGKIAAVHLMKLSHETPLNLLRGKIHDFEGRRVIATFHPSYLLRNPESKVLVWRDLQPIISKR